MRKVPPYLLLDAWRGVAALWVVMTHACLAFLATGDNARFMHQPLYAVGVWGQLGVVIFFVISGFCIMGAAHGALLGGRSVSQYAFDRVRRIYPPYLAAGLVAAALSLFLQFAQAHHWTPPLKHPPDFQHWTSPGYWFANVFLVQIETGQPQLLFVAWSLCYEVIFYAVIGVTLVLARLAGRRSGELAPLVFLAGAAVLTLVSLLWLLIAPESCVFPFERSFQFGTGVLIFLVFAFPSGQTARLARAQLVVVALLTLALALGFGTPDSRPLIMGQPPLRVQAGATLLFAVVLLGLRPIEHKLAHSRWLRPLMWLGVISYSLYLVHPLVMFVPDIGLRRLGFDHERYWVTDLAEIGFAILCGWLFHLAVERHFISSRQKKRIAEEQLA